MYRRTGLIETKLRNKNVCCIKAINNNIQIRNDYLLHFHSTKNEISRFRIFFERRKSLNAMQTSLGFKRRKFKSAKLCVSHMFTDIILKFILCWNVFMSYTSRYENQICAELLRFRTFTTHFRNQGNFFHRQG